MKFEKYDSYKSNDIDFFEKIPIEWKIQRIKDISKYISLV